MTHQPPPPKDLRTLIAEEEEHSDGRRGKLYRWFGLVAPVGTTLALLGVAAVLEGPEKAGQIVLAMVAIFTILGKFAIPFGAGESVPFGSFELAMIVSYMDVAVATVLVFNLPALYRLPRVGPILEELAEHGHYMLEKRPGLARVTFLGVIGFVMFPLTGTGAIGGSIFGRLLGLGPKRTLLAIAIGALTGSFGMALFADTVKDVFPAEVRSSWQFQAVGAALILAVVGVIWQRGRRVSRELKARRDARPDSTDGE